MLLVAWEGGCLYRCAWMGVEPRRIMKEFELRAASRLITDS